MVINSCYEKTKNCYFQKSKRSKTFYRYKFELYRFAIFKLK